MVRKICVLIGLFATLAASISADQPKKKEKVVAFTGATLIDGTGAIPVKNAVIIIERNKIRAVGKKGQVDIPEDAEVIDVKGKWILPGFMDMHIHLTYPLNMQMELSDDDCLRTLRALNVMNKYLKTGVTTVRDVTSHNMPMRALKRAAQLKYTHTIRLFSVGEGIVSTGGHGDILSGADVADGPDEYRKAVRMRKRLGFKYVKLLSHYTKEELCAAVEEAKSLGLRISVHSGSPVDIRRKEPVQSRMAVEYGVDCLEHAGYIDDETLRLMADKGVQLVPTMSILRLWFKDVGGVEKIKERMKPEFAESVDWEAVTKKAKEYGVIIGVGTDYVMQYTQKYPECFFDEMKYYLEIGFTPMETIVCATKNGAIILGKEDELGTIEEGKLADIQVINGNPLESFDVLGKPEMVMIDGKIHTFPVNKKQDK